MTKKDYELIAGIIREERRSYVGAPDRSPDATLEELSIELAEALKLENNRFQTDRFLAACRGEDSKDSAGRKVRYSTTHAETQELAEANYRRENQDRRDV